MAKKADKPPKLAAVIRRALGDLGLEASAGDVRGWIAQHMAGYEYNDGTLSATLAGQRKLARQQAEASPAEPAPAVPAAAPAPAVAPVAASPSVPSAEDLLAVKKLADGGGGVAELLRAVRSLTEMAKGVGGVERLERCLDYLQRMGVK